MTAPSAPGLLDPLGAQEPAPLQVIPSAAVARRRDRVAPEVITMDGAEAVALVRAGGFVAAIESVPSELPEGTVIEQEPPAGVGLEREAVITLRLATPLIEVAPALTEAERGRASEQAPRTADPDDTEEWFEALALNERRDGASGRRRRKHRSSRPSAHELVFDPVPAPSLGLGEPPGAVTSLEETRSPVSARRLIGAAMFLFPPSLAGMPWRRASAIVAGLLLFVLLGMRLFASSDRRAQSSDQRTLTRDFRAQVVSQSRVGRSRPLPRRAFGPARRRGAEHSRPRSVRHRVQAWTANAAPVATVPDQHAHQSQALATPVTTATRPASGQFAYLGQ